jgi:hypothetical protein
MVPRGSPKRPVCCHRAAGRGFECPAVTVAGLSRSLGVEVIFKVCRCRQRRLSVAAHWLAAPAASLHLSMWTMPFSRQALIRESKDSRGRSLHDLLLSLRVWVVRPADLASPLVKVGLTPSAPLLRSASPSAFTDSGSLVFAALPQLRSSGLVVSHDLAVLLRLNPSRGFLG